MTVIISTDGERQIVRIPKAKAVTVDVEYDEYSNLLDGHGSEISRCSFVVDEPHRDANNVIYQQIVDHPKGQLNQAGMMYAALSEIDVESLVTKTNTVEAAKQLVEKLRDLGMELAPIEDWNP